MGFFFGNVFPVVFFVIFFLILAMVVVSLVRGLAQWNKNNHSPRLTVPADVVAKRQSVTHHNHNAGGSHHTHTSTSYFATFQVESGDRMELRVSGQEYGMLAEGDRGRLTFQGTRYLSFERTGTAPPPAGTPSRFDIAEPAPFRRKERKDEDPWI